MKSDFTEIFKYMIADVECLYDYFSFQLKTENMKKVYIADCYNDQDCKKLYNILQRVDRPIYVYSLDYDAVMINVFCKLVEKKERDILYKLRDVSNFLFKNIEYFNLIKELWGYFRRIKEENTNLEYKQLLHEALLVLKKAHPDSLHQDFLNNYSFLLSKSKVYKNLTINSIPKIYGYFTTDKYGRHKMTISLKKLQLIQEGYNIKFDFNKYETIQNIKDDGLFDTWTEYSSNDVLFLEKLFLGKPKDDIIKRWYAYKAILKIDKNFKLNIMDIFSENNTNIINSILKIKNPNKDIEVDYTKYIFTDEPKFNEFVKFVNDNKDLDDKYIKEEFKKYYNDSHNNIDMMECDEITIGGLLIKYGLGGIHGAINNYVGENLLHLDYVSEYPSIVLQYRELFENIINVDMYEAIYSMRIKMKAEGKKSKEAMFIQNGIKLLINSVFGLINSTFNIPIACKTLGKFITLRGQALLINLTNKVLKEDPDTILINVNTDGLIIDTKLNMDNLIKDDLDGYFKLGTDIITKMIQKDVNNYIKIVDGKMKTKGMFNLTIKQHINKNERLSINTMNALKLIDNQKVEILPIYFDVKWINKEDKAYYFTDKKHGEQAIKLTKKTEVLTSKNEVYYFTDNKKYAKIDIYERYAEEVKDAILNFSLIKVKQNKGATKQGQYSIFDTLN